MDAPEGYNRNRRHRTWHEEHPESKKERRERAKTTEERTRNRLPGRFGKVNWDSYQHFQMYDMIMKADPDKMSLRAEQWSALAREITATTGHAQRVMERVMGAWRGQAAVSSAESNSRLMRWADEVSHTTAKIAKGMSTYTEAVAEAKSKMPDPAFATAERNFRDGYTVTGTGGPSTAVLIKQLLSDGMVSHEQARARKAEAVQVMEAYEAQSKDVHDTMPNLPPKHPITRPVDPWTPTTVDPPLHQDPPRDGRPAQPPNTTVPGTPQHPLPPGALTGQNNSTTAAGFVDPALTGAGGPGGSGGSGGGPGGTGYGGAGGLGSLGSGGDTARGGPGSLAGAGGLAGRGAAGPMGASPMGARGAGPGAGAFGGMPMGAGAPGEEDKEHKNKYHEGMDFLDDLPPAYPSVFGA